MRVLVTGGAGYIGGAMSALLLAEGHEVVVLDNLSTGHRDGVPAGAELREADLREADAVRKAVDGSFDGVLHFAAKSLVGESMELPADYFATSVGGTLNLLAAMREHDVSSLVVSSTAATYGQPQESPITEQSPTQPLNAYGAAKLAVDHLLSYAAPAYGIGAVSLRYFNVAGAYAGLAERHDPETHLIPNLLKSAADPGKPFTINGTDFPTPDGTCIRDYVHVQDLARAHLLALSAARSGEHQIFNLGSGSGYSVLEVLAEARSVTRAELPAVEGPPRPGGADPATLVASSAKIERELGWTRQRSLTDMVRDAWDLVPH